MSPLVKKRILSCITIFFLLLFLLLAGSRFALRRGVRFDHLSLGPVTLTRLVLSLDQGFIVEAKQVDIDATSSLGDSPGPGIFLPLLKKWSYLIREIDIGAIRFRDYSAGLHYRDDRFRITGRDVSLDAIITFDETSLQVDLTALQIPPMGISMTVRGSYSRGDDLYLFDGEIGTPWGTGSLAIRGSADNCTVRLSTEPFTDLAALLRRFPIDEDIPAWVGANITADSFQVNGLRLDLKLSEIARIGPANVSGTAVAKGAAIRFHPDLDPVRSDKIDISYQNDKLSFKLSTPEFRKKKLAGSTVVIAPLIGAGSILDIHLLTEAALDRDILDILTAYDISLPMRQISGVTRADLRLLLALPDFTLRTRGRFTTGSGTWQWGRSTWQVTRAEAVLHDRTISLGQADLAYDTLFSGSLSGEIDTDTGRARLLCNVDKLHYAMKGTPLVDLADKKIPLRVAFDGTTTTVAADDYQTTFTIRDNEKLVTISNLAPLSAAIPLLKARQISQGNVTARMDANGTITADADVIIPNPYLSLEGNPVTRFRIHGTGNRSRAHVSINDDRITLYMVDRQVKAAIRDYLVTLDTGLFNDETDFQSPLPLEITGPAILLKISDIEIPTGEFRFRESDRHVSLNAQTLGGDIEFTYQPDGLTLVGRNLDAELFDAFFENMDLSRGIFDVVLQGRVNNIEGFIEAKNILIRNTKIINNIMAFINTIPALMTFSAPGFDSNGYVVRDAVAYFNYHKNRMTVHHLRLDGETVDAEAQGWIDRGTRTINMTFELFTLKDYSKIINKIPLAGYAILGEDGRLSTALNLTGDLDNPDITTNLATDILATPINVIKRTIQWPFQLFQDNKPSREYQKPNGLKPEGTGFSLP